MDAQRLDAELELITASLLPAENITVSDGDVVKRIKLTSHDSKFSLHMTVSNGYPSRKSVTIIVQRSGHETR